MTKRGNEIGPEMVPLVSKAHLWQGLLFGALLVLISGVMVFGFCYWKKLCCFSRLSARSPDVRYNAPLQEVVIV